MSVIEFINQPVFRIYVDAAYFFLKDRVVKLVYNANDKDTDIGYGNGWRLNYVQELVKEEISTTTGDTT